MLHGRRGNGRTLGQVGDMPWDWGGEQDGRRGSKVRGVPVPPLATSS